MLDRNLTPSDPGYLRDRARGFRKIAGGAGDAVIHAELLQLATLYERMAAEAESDARVRTTHE